MAARKRSQRGGIAALVRLNEDSRGALDYDTMTLLGIRLETVPSTIGWDGLVIFARHLPHDSATMRWALDSGDGWSGEWMGSFLTNELLADLADLLNIVRWNYQSVHSKGARPKRPTPMERPWVKSREKKHVGKGAISKKEFLQWYYGGD